MRGIVLFLLALIAFLLSGCATTLTGSYLQKPDPDYQIRMTDAILVTVQKNDINSKYYVDYVAQKLRDKGFADVYTYRENYPSTIKNTLVFKVEEEFSSYNYSSADYGLVDSGTSTTNCYGIGNYANCTTTKNKTYGVTGYSQKTNYVHGHYFVARLYEEATERIAFVSVAATYEKQCSSDKLYKFLIDETIARMNFEGPAHYKFSVEMPDGYSCRQK